MIAEGLKLKFTDHRDYDLLKTFGAANFDTNGLPDKYLSDAGLTMPNQNEDGFIFGCTGYAQTELCTDEDRVVYDAGEFYLNTPPGGKSVGRDLRSSLKLLTSRGPRDHQGNLGPKRTAYYNIRSTGILDWFDAIRVALWITQDERRSSSIAIPWFKEFHAVGRDGICPETVNFSWSNASGHNAKCAGWTRTNTAGQMIRNGEVFLAVKSWQGKEFGDNGWCYWSRPLANSVFNMNYTEAFTVTKMVGVPQTVNLEVVEKLISYVLYLLRKLGSLFSS